MTNDDLLRYCLTLPGAWTDEPWEGTLVSKVDKKIFVFHGDDSISLKCGDDRDEADEWLVRHPESAAVMAYIGRSGWNTLSIDGSIPDDELLEAIDDSYEMVVSKIPKSRRPEGWDGLTGA